MDLRTRGKAAMGCGYALLVPSLVATAFFAFYVFVDRHGMSDDESAPGLLSGLCCLFVSVAITAGGTFVAFRKDTEPTAASTQMPPSRSATLGVGCGALVALCTACVAASGVAHFSSEAERWSRIRDDDVRTGMDPYVVLSDEGAMHENQIDAQLSAGCAACSGAVGLLGVGGAVALHRRRRRAASA